MKTNLLVMPPFVNQLIHEISFIKIRNIVLILIIGYIIVQFIAWIVRKLFWKNASPQSKMILNKLFVYGGIIIILLLVLKEAGIQLAALLGAAGVAGIVLGIASQTSIGNVISGIFLVSEKSFELGDLIKIGDKMGTVYSIDLLSVKLKTLDNLLIRIPNQSIISNDVTNITRFPIRRMDLNLSVAYKEDLKKVMQILQDLALKNIYCLNEPEPLILIRNFGDSGIEFLFGLWFEKSNYLKLKNSIMQEIKQTFDNEGIEIPFPHISVYTGEKTKPLPVSVIKG